MSELGYEEHKQIAHPIVYDYERNDFAFRNTELIPDQDRFAQQKRSIYLLPLRAEYANGNLAAYLTQMLEQQKHTDNSLGLIILVNNLEQDKESIKEDNVQATKFLSTCLNPQPTDEDIHSLPPQYQTVLEQLQAARPRIDIRFDAITVTDGRVMGRLRTHLLALAEKYLPLNYNPDEVIAHFSDVDTEYAPKHTAIVERAMNETVSANVAASDYFPAEFEGVEHDPSFNRDMLKTFDDLRLIKIARRINSWLRGGHNTVTPTYSGKMSLFLRSDFRHNINYESVNDDYEIGRYLRNNPTIKKSYVSEVYISDRARRPDLIYEALGQAISDAHNRYFFTKDPHDSIKKIYPDLKSSYDTEDAQNFLMSQIPVLRNDPLNYNWMGLLEKVAPPLARILRDRSQYDQEIMNRFATRIQGLLDGRKMKWDNPEFYGMINEEPYDSESEHKMFTNFMLTNVLPLFNLQDIGIKDYYNLPEDTQLYIQDIMELISSFEKLPEPLKDESLFKELLSDAEKKEQAKLRLRQQRLRSYIHSLHSGNNDEKTFPKHVDVFRRNFAFIEQKIQSELSDGLDIETIFQNIIKTYPETFSYESGKFHLIAQLNAVESYIKQRNVTIFKQTEYQNRLV